MTRTKETTNKKWVVYKRVITRSARRRKDPDLICNVALIFQLSTTLSTNWRSTIAAQLRYLDCVKVIVNISDRWARKKKSMLKRNRRWKQLTISQGKTNSEVSLCTTSVVTEFSTLPVLLSQHVFAAAIFHFIFRQSLLSTLRTRHLPNSLQMLQ